MSQHSGNTTFYQKASNETLSLQDIFSGMFDKHDKSVTDRILTAGTVHNTPSQGEMLGAFTKPWLFFRVLMGGVGILVLLYLMIYLGLSSYVTTPFVFIGSLIVPLSVVVLFFELNIPKNISIFDVVIMILVGGCASLIITVIFSEFIPTTEAQWAPLTEEPGKILAMCIFFRKPRKYYILNGVLIGGAIGAGFAFIETTGYVLNNNYSMSTLIMRGVLAIGCHVLWAAIEGGIIAKVIGNGQFTASCLFKQECLIYFVASMILHFLWNYDFYLFALPIILDVKFLLLTVIGWAILLKLINMGMKEILLASKRASPHGVAAPVERNGVGTLSCIQGLSGMYLGQEIPLSAKGLVLGRDAGTCNLIFNKHAAKVSRNHCTITFHQGRYFLCDQSSSNGTFLQNHGRVQPGQQVELKPNTRFYIGDKYNMFVVK